MILSVLLWIFGVIFALKLIIVLRQTIKNQSNDPTFKKFMDKGFDYSEMNGLTKSNIDSFEKFRKEILTVFLLGIILLVLIVINFII